MENLQKFIDYFKNYTNNFSTIGIVFLIVDVLLVIGLIIFFQKILKVKFKIKKVILFSLIIALIYGITFFLNFEITFFILKTLAFWSVGIILILYSQEIKHALESGLHNNTNDNLFSSEEVKMNVVNTLVESAEYLSERKIGGLIVIERSDSLDSFINKAIYIKGKVSAELLTSLFYTGSATHDGAVIIRKNSIMCAGAYLPSTDKYDVPKSLGTRHRAAIGLSEKYDAVTIVVSEETGKISITVDGIIQLDLSLDKLKELLSQYLLSK